MIEIRELKGQWSQNIIKKLCRDISGLTDPVSRITESKRDDNFQISVFCDRELESVEDENAEYLKRLIDEKPVLKIHGEFNPDKNAFIFTEGENDKREISLNDPKIRACGYGDKGS